MRGSERSRAINRSRDLGYSRHDLNREHSPVSLPTGRVFCFEGRADSGPISLFANRSQTKLAQLFDRGHDEPIEFGVGYRWRSQTSNLMLAVKTDAANDRAVAGTQPAQPSVEVLVGGENGSDVNRTESGNNAGAHKTAGRGKVHQVTKHPTRDKWIARTRVRTRTLQAHDGARFWFRSWN